MKLLQTVCVFAAFALLAHADVIQTYTDSINDHNFANATYELTAANNKVITFSSFGDGSSMLSGLETSDTPNMFEPNSTTIQIPDGSTLISAEYDLAYEFGLGGNRNVTDLPGTNRAQTDPVFGFDLDNLRVQLVFKDGEGDELNRVNVTNLSGPLDLMPYIMDGGVVEAAFLADDLFLKTRFVTDGVQFTADLSSYNPSANPDRNVTIDYTLKAQLFAESDATFDFTPEPAPFGLIGIGLAGILAAARKLRA